MNWKAAFEICQPSSGATAAQLDEFAREVAAPLSVVELEEISHAHRKVMAALPSIEPLDTSQWHLPDNPFPSSYLDFLRWSDGGFFRGRYRNLDPLFSTGEVRSYLLAYSIPLYMPGTLPIGFDGGGTFYLFDMRNQSKEGDYPILLSDAGCLAFTESASIARSFEEFISSGLGAEAP